MQLLNGNYELCIMNYELKTMNYQEAVNYLFTQLPVFEKTGGDAYKPGLGTATFLYDGFDEKDMIRIYILL